jgi:hypothetical protein
MSLRRFCKKRGIAEHLFSNGKRLRNQQQPVRFALLERGAAPHQAMTDAGVELMLATGERLRIGTGVSATNLRTILEV